MSATNVARLTALGVDVVAQRITIADGKRNYTEKVISAPEAGHWFFKSVTKKTPTLRRLEGGLDPALKSEGNWTENGRDPARLFNYGGVTRVKHIFAFAFLVGDASVNRALTVLGWMPPRVGDYSFLHVFQVPAGTRYASSGVEVRPSSEVMFPDLVPEAMFTSCFRIDHITGGTMNYPRM
jgi:hypothetical protein